MAAAIKKPHAGFNWIIECICLTGLLITILMIAINYSSLPDTIPMHFNASGNVDGYGNKLSIWITPFLVGLTYAALSIAERFPHKFNYLIEITEVNADRQYDNAIWMIRIIKIQIILLFLYLSYVTVENATTGSNTLGTWFLPIVLFGILGTAITFIVRSYQLK